MRTLILYLTAAAIGWGISAYDKKISDAREIATIKLVVEKMDEYYEQHQGSCPRGL